MRELNVAELSVGEVVHVIAGEGEDTNEYRFTVTDEGTYPVGNLIQRPNGDDVTLGPSG